MLALVSLVGLVGLFGLVSLVAVVTVVAYSASGYIASCPPNPPAFFFIIYTRKSEENDGKPIETRKSKENEGRPMENERKTYPNRKTKKTKNPKKIRALYIYIIFTKTGNGGVTTYELT